MCGLINGNYYHHLCEYELDSGSYIHCVFVVDADDTVTWVTRLSSGLRRALSGNDH